MTCVEFFLDLDLNLLIWWIKYHVANHSFHISTCAQCVKCGMLSRHLFGQNLFNEVMSPIKQCFGEYLIQLFKATNIYKGWPNYIG